jgi:hypothetical protein
VATAVLIIAESGAGKSTAIENLVNSETFIVNVANKDLPFRGWKSKYPKLGKDTPMGLMKSVTTPQGVIDAMSYVNDKRPEIKNLVVDDWQYVSAFEFFERASEKGYDKFTDIGAALTAMARKPQTMRDDLIIYFLTHADEGTDIQGNKKYKAKTIGKMVDEKLTLEGLFSIVLFGKVKRDKEGNTRHVFETRNSGDNTCKSPKGMFEDFEIPNDLAVVRQAILEYEK